MKYLLFFISINLLAQTQDPNDPNVSWLDGRVYFIDKSQVKLVWDPVATAEYYKAEEIWIDPTPDIIYSLGNHITATEVVILRRRAGHFTYRVMACRINTDGQELCSTWACSIDPAYAILNNNGPGAWYIYFRLPPPSGIIIQ